jgi:hypothetical protein
MTTAVEKYASLRSAVRYEISEFSNGAWPQRAMALFTTFAADFNRTTGQVELANKQLCGFLSARSRVVEKQQQRVVAAALGGEAIRSAQKRIHLRFVEIGDDYLAGFLEWNGTDLTTPGNVLRTVLSHEASQRVDRGQPLVAGVNPALPRLFQIDQEEPH